MTVESLFTLNHYLGLATLVLVFVTLALIVDMVYVRKFESAVRRFGLHTALMVTLIAVVLTLVYSEYFGIIPCGLCWMERMALYPQLILIAGALYLKDALMPKYGIALSVFGGVVSLYHHYIQMGGSEFIKCPAAGADCAKRYLFEFDFLTFPLIATFLFAFLIALYVYILKTRSN